MTSYKCGHSHDVIVACNNPLSIFAYLEWRETVGFGDRSLCFDCFVKKVQENVSAKTENIKQ